MYFPYLYGRRFELLALRDVAIHLNVSKRLMPIIEPVAKKPNDLSRCLQVLNESGSPAILIINPAQAEFKHGVDSSWKRAIHKAIGECPLVIPGLVCGPKITPADIAKFVESYAPRQVALLYSNPKLTDSEMKSVAAYPTVAFHIVIQDRIAEAMRSRLPEGKTVDVREHFKEMPKNSDYEGSELFSDRHLTFKKRGVGFGDYSVIGGTYRKGGGKPAAVVIHLVFVESRTKHLHVQHFVSDDIEQDVGSVPEKFLQALEKLVEAVTERPEEFGASSALSGYLEDHENEHFSGLGENKRRQIVHHIALVCDLLKRT